MKRKDNIVAPKLYHGTTEIIAKAACVKGLAPYDINAIDNGCPRNIRASTDSGICLTSVYPGLMAFETATYKDKWGIIEIDITHLCPDLFLPYEGFLLEKIKGKITGEEDKLKRLSQIRQGLASNRRKWRESIDGFGMCVYEGEIPLSAISKVFIYNPQSNPIMTKFIIGSVLGSKVHQANLHRHHMLTRWLMGDNVLPEEWLGSSVFAKMPHSEKDKMSQILQNKHGLDIFHSSSVNSKKITWW
jgi:hypothetical protein